jgi:hypothetical protein
MANLLGTTTIGGHQAIHVGNISSYAGISTATGDARYLQLSGGTLTGTLGLPNSGLISVNGEPDTWGARFRTTISTTNLGTQLKNIIWTGGGANEGFVVSGNGTGGAALEVNNNGTVWAKESFRAPIFYDSNDTNYYLDLNSNSRLVNLGLGGSTPDVRLSISGDIHLDGYLYQGGTAGTVTSWGSRTLVSSGNYVSNARSFAFNNVGYGSSWTFAISSDGALTTNRHIDANTTWTNDAITLFLGWYGGKVVIGNNNESNHDNASGLGGNTIAVTNTFYSFEQSNLYYDGSLKLYMGSDGTRNTGWAYHTNNGTGLHWPNNGWHLMPDGSTDFRIYSGSGSESALRFETTGTTRGYVYANSSNEIGFLNQGRTWRLRVYSGGAVESYGDFRAPIFYDSNDTNYYLDPNAGTSGYLAGVLRQNNGKYVRDSAIQTFSGQASYYSGGEAGWYRVAEIALTGNCGGAVIYGTLYDNRYDGADTYQIAVVARSDCDFTSNNESHYINVGCTILGSTNYTNYRSKIRVLLVESSTNLKRYELQFYETNWNNDTWQLESTGWTVYTSAQAPRSSVGGERVNYISNHNADYLRANTAAYSPIYYDSDDTGYYLDLNSTSDSAMRIRGGTYYGPNPTWGAYLYVGTNGRVGSSATVAVTNGNLHIDSQTGYALYLNWYSTNDIYTQANLGVGSDSASYRLHVHGTGYATSDFRAPIFYDSNDTNYYGDFASTSVLNVARINSIQSPNGSDRVAADAAMPNAGHSFIHTLAFGPGDNDGHILGMTWANTTSVYGAQIFIDTDPNDIMAIRSRSAAGAWTSWKTVIHSGTIGSQSVNYASSAGSASSATTATNLGADYTADDWFRATADNNPVKFYGNSYQMTWRTDGVSEAYSDIGGYPFVWTYGGSSSGNRRMLMDTSGNLWTNTYGWLHDYFQLASSAINTGNIGSQSVSYAATAGSADNIDGWGFRNTGSNDSVNADTIDSNGITYYTDGVPNFSGNATDGALYSQRYSGSWQHQIAGDYRSGQIALRGRNNGTWQAWRTVLDSTNASYAAAMNQNVRTDSDPTFNSAYFANGNLRLYQGGGTALHIQTAYGYGLLGPQNGSWFHLETDRDNFYFGRSVYVNGSVHIYGGSQLVENNGGTWNISVSGNSATTSQRSFDYIYTTSYLESAGAVYGTIFYDNNDRDYYVDPNGTSNLNKLSARTMSYNDMNSMSVNSPYVERYNGSSLYRNGTMGYETTDFNVMFSNWGSGFIDSWSSPANAPGGSSHYVGLQGFHYSHVNNSQAYGFQMACAGEADNRFFWRSAWPNLRSWVEMMHTGNSPYAWNMNQYVRTSDAPTFNGVYTNDWFRANGCTGLYFETYGYGLRAPECEGNTYGNVVTYGTGRNGWSGYGIGSQYVIMGRVGTDVGLHDNNFGWGWYWHSGNRCLGIGESSTSSGYRLYVTGAIYATDDIVAYSDVRKKTNIETIPEALDTVMKLRGVFYDRTDSMEKGRQLGVIAQEVNAVLPEAVSYAEDTDEYGVKYGNIVGVLIEAIKEQQAQIDELKKRLGE